MIHLVKGPMPAVLATNAAAWTKVLDDHQANGTTPTEAEKGRYRHHDIKAALLAETKDKCAYCESQLRHITYGDIEHVVPKVTSNMRWFQWSNLTIACDICNTNKSSHFGNHDDLVDPYVMDPTQHFQFAGANVLPIPGNAPAFATESTLQLNRAKLLERRSERLLMLNKQIHLLMKVANPGERAVLRRDLEREFESDKEFSAMAKQHIQTQLRKLDALMAVGNA